MSPYHAQERLLAVSLKLADELGSGTDPDYLTAIVERFVTSCAVYEQSLTLLPTTPG